MSDIAIRPEERPLPEVLAEWRARGLTPTEITDGEQLQRITITHDPLRGQLKWETKGPLDGLIATELIADAALLMPAVVVGDAAVSIAEYFTRDEGRLDLGTGQATVIVAFSNGRLALDWQPKEAPIAAKKLLAAALLYLVARDAGLPLENLLRALGMGDQ